MSCHREIGLNYKFKFEINLTTYASCKKNMLSFVQIVKQTFSLYLEMLKYRMSIFYYIAKFYT